MTDQEKHDQKEVEFYAAAVEAWLGTSLEHDKSLRPHNAWESLDLENEPICPHR
jgi:hypothetical protein